MRLPIIKKQNRYKKSIVTFGGINRTGNFTEGELEDATSISHRLFPAITQRRKTSLVFPCDSPSAAVVADKECIAADGVLYYDREKVATLTSGKKTLAVLGKKIFVFPDKLYYDTQTQKVGDMCGFASSCGAKVSFMSNTITFPEVYVKEERDIVKDTFPKDMKIVAFDSASVNEGRVILSKPSLKNLSQLADGSIHNEKCNENEYCIVQSAVYSEENESYTVTSEKITVINLMKDIFKELCEGDVVEISGCSDIPENNKSVTIVSKAENSLTFDADTFTEGDENATVTVQRKIPDFTCVCSYENRLWGCEKNTIYASALGDGTNFFRYKNLSTDSFSVESNGAGDFTACTVFANGCLFFKENVCYRLFGSRPSNFQLSQCFEGGMLSSDKESIVNMGGRLLYKGVGGVYVYYGGTPQRISDKLGDITLENATAGSDGKNYFLTADTKDGREEFVWDSEKNLWSKSGIKDTTSYLCFGEDVYRLNTAGMEKTEKDWDEDTLWSMTLCPFDEGYYKTKSYSRIHICAELFSGAYIRTEVRKDGGLWEVIDTSYGDEKKYLNIPCVIKGCHEVQIRLSGKGKSIINSIVREFSIGSLG